MPEICRTEANKENTPRPKEEKFEELEAIPVQTEQTSTPLYISEQIEETRKMGKVRSMKEL